MTPVYGDCAKIGCVDYYPIKFNPMFDNSECESEINKLIFGDGLFTYDQSGNLINGLAESAEQENDHIWHVKLYSDVQFHDRSQLVSEDVKFSFELYKKFSLEVPKLFQFRLINNIEILDRLNLRIILKEHLEDFKQFIGQMPILPKNKYEHWLDYNYVADLPMVIPAVGTGYFLHRQEGPNNEVRLEFNPVHYKKWANLGGVDFVFFETYDQMVDAYLSEKIDVIQVQGSTVRQKIFQILGSFNFLSVPRDDIKLYYINLNTTAFPFNDKEIRRALNYAINRSFIVDKYLDDNARIAYNLLNEKSKYFLEQPKPVHYNPRHSLEILTRDGYKRKIGKLENNDRELRFDIYFEEGSEFEESLIRLISINLLELGINVVPKPLKPKDIKTLLERGDYQAALQHFVYDPRYSIEALKAYYFQELNKSDEFKNYSDRFINQRFKMSNDPSNDMEQIMFQIQNRMYQDIPCIYLFFQENTFYAIDNRFSHVRNPVYKDLKSILKLYPIYEWYVPKDKQKYKIY